MAARTARDSPAPAYQGSAPPRVSLRCGLSEPFRTLIRREHVLPPAGQHMYVSNSSYNQTASELDCQSHLPVAS